MQKPGQQMDQHKGIKKNLTKEDLSNGHVYASSWPSMFIGGYIHVRAVRVLPINSEKTMITAEWLFETSALNDHNYDIKNVIDFGCLVMEQDAIELNQKGLKSEPYQNGFLMPGSVIKKFMTGLERS